MKIDWSFPKRVLLTLVVFAAVGAYPFAVYATPEIRTGIVAGLVISVLNVFLGYLSIEYSFGKSTKTFMKAVLGGMGIRLVATMTAVLILLEVYDYHMISFVSSLLVFYFIFVLYEVLHVNRKVILSK
jgi:hypothetical protein